MTLYVGLGHYKRTGKDSFANFLIQELEALDPAIRVVKKSFAWKMKQICHELYGWAGLREPEFYETSEGEKLREVVLPEIGKSPRQIWIAFGTNAVRDQVYQDTWLRHFFSQDYQCDVLIVPDVRFPNEVNEFEVRNGILIKVVRPGYGPGPNVPDRALLGFDRWSSVIGEVGTMDSIREWASQWAVWITASLKRPAAEVTRIPIRPRAEIEAALAVEKIEPWNPSDE